MEHETVLKCIKFVREELTHLDAHLLQDIQVHPELFLEPNLTADLITRVTNGEVVQATTEIFGPDPNEPLSTTRYNHSAAVEVISFNPSIRYFHCKVLGKSDAWIQRTRV
jgi:hypothetical protein